MDTERAMGCPATDNRSATMHSPLFTESYAHSAGPALNPKSPEIHANHIQGDKSVGNLGPESAGERRDWNSRGCKASADPPNVYPVARLETVGEPHRDSRPPTYPSKVDSRSASRTLQSRIVTNSSSCRTSSNRSKELTGPTGVRTAAREVSRSNDLPPQRMATSLHSTVLAPQLQSAAPATCVHQSSDSSHVSPSSPRPNYCAVGHRPHAGGTIENIFPGRFRVPRIYFEFRTANG